MAGFLCHWALIKWFTKAWLSCLKLEIDLGGSLEYQTLAEAFRVVWKALHMISSGTAWSVMKEIYVSRWSTGSVVPSKGSIVGILFVKQGFAHHLQCEGSVSS